jgi:hypothetical protein
MGADHAPTSCVILLARTLAASAIATTYLLLPARQRTPDAQLLRVYVILPIPALLVSRLCPAQTNAGDSHDHERPLVESNAAFNSRNQFVRNLYRFSRVEYDGTRSTVRARSNMSPGTSDATHLIDAANDRRALEGQRVSLAPPDF